MTRSALAPVVSEEIHVDITAEEYDYDYAGLSKLFCNDVRCATFFGGGLDSLYLLPGSEASRPIYLRDLYSETWGTNLRVLALPNDEYLIAGGTYDGGDDVERFAHRVRGADGAILGPVPNAAVLGEAGDLHSNGDSVLAITLTGYGWTARVFDRESYAPRGPAVPIAYPVESTPRPPVVVPGEGQFLVVWSGYAQRIDSTTGNVLDDPPLRPSLYSSGPSVGAYLDGTYYLAWVDFRGLVMSRLRASDGARLDPDDDFNQISGAKVVCNGTCSPGLRLPLLAVSPLEDEVLVTWGARVGNSGPYSTQGVLVNPATGLRSTGTASSAATTLTTTPEEPIAAQFTAERGAVMETNHTTFVDLETAPLSATTLGRTLLFRGRTTPAPPSVGHNSEGTFLVAWGDQQGDLKAARFSNQGEMLEEPFQVGTVEGRSQYEPVDVSAVASSGTDFLVAWTSYNRVHRRIVHGNGSLGPALPTWSPTSGQPTHLNLVFNGDYFYLTFGQGSAIHGQRLLPNGDAFGEPIWFSAPTRWHVTLADTVPPSDRRSFVTVLGNGIVRRLRSQTGSLVAETNVDCSAAPHRGASNGTDLFIACGGRGIFVDPVSGTEVEGSSRPLPYDPNFGGDVLVPLVWHDGRSFLTLIDRTLTPIVARRFTLRRFDDTLTELDAEVGGFGHFVNQGDYYSHASAASGVNGRSLLAYQTFDPRLFGRVLKARVIDNDGLPAPASPGDQNPEFGEGGASGEGSGGGNSGAANGGGDTAGAPSTGGSAGGDSGAPGVGGTAGEVGGGPNAGGEAGHVNAGHSGSGAATGEAGRDGDAGGGASSGDAGTAGVPASGGAEPGTGGSSARGGASGNATGGASNGGHGGTSGSAGTNAGGDSGEEAAAGAGGGGESDDGGCGCTIPKRTTMPRGLGLLLAVAALALRRRRGAASRRRAVSHILS